MSILIKGMEMPREESITIKIFPSGAIADQYWRLDERVTAIEIPPHGRLVDADKLRVVHGVNVDDMYGGLRAVVFKRDIDNAPTVIEAEGKE